MNNWKFLRNVVIKTLILLVVLNLLFTGCSLERLGQLSLYNRIVPGRERFPFGENAQFAYNLSLYNLNAMIASHRVAGGAADAYRVFLLGDSSVWGSLLAPEETLASQLNQRGLKTCAGDPVEFYNLGYPTLSLTKDVMILEAVRRYQPDLVIWMVTLESFPLSRQLDSPLVAHNPARVRSLIETYGLPIDPQDPRFVDLVWWERTWIGQRRGLADLVRLQLYGPMWAATGVDQALGADYPAAQRDFKAEDNRFHEAVSPTLRSDELGFSILAAGIQAASPAKVVLVNEPILISSGQNSQVRYNFYYPRWAYDQYRVLLTEQASQRGWKLADFWNLAAENEFTNSAIHLSKNGTGQLAQSMADTLRSELCR